MHPLSERYREWASKSLAWRPVFVVGVGFTLFSLVVLPGQWIPVLFRDDLTVVGLSLVILGLGALVGTASMGRSGSPGTKRAPLVAALFALALVVGAVLLYKWVFEGIGWPEASELAVGVSFVVASSLAGMGLGAVSRRLLRPVYLLLTAAAFVLVGVCGVWLFSDVLPTALEPDYHPWMQSCEVRNGIEYCANPGYEPFVARWQAVVEEVIEVAPVEVDRSQILIAQLLDNDGGRVENASASPGLDWGKGAGKPIARLAFGLDVANWITGLDTRGMQIDKGQALGPCDSGTDARSVVAYWLAGQLGGDVEEVISELGCCADAISGSTFAMPAVGGGWQVATHLLDEPQRDMETRIGEHWDELVDPRTSVSRLAEILDLGTADSPNEGSRDGCDQEIVTGAR